MLLDKLRATSRSQPGRLAVVASSEQLTYGELDELSTRLAVRLRGEGLVRGALVAIYTRRTVDTIVCMFGIMKAGAAYTVVEDDGRHTENRNRLLSIQADLVLCENEDVSALRALSLRVLSPESVRDLEPGWPALSPEGNDTAYVLFTSGSTGKPKGVAVTHDNIAHYTDSIVARLGIVEGMHYAHVSTLAADLGNTSLFLAFWTGGCLHLVDAETRKDPAALREYLIERRIDFLKITPSHWKAIFASFRPEDMARSQLRYLVLGGEALPVSLARKIIESGVAGLLVNHYGPTETTVGVTVFPVYSVEQLDALPTDTVPIGLPIGRTVLRVRTESGSFAEKGVRGELYIAGPSVAVGYRGDPGTTASSFVSMALTEDGR